MITLKKYYNSRILNSMQCFHNIYSYKKLCEENVTLPLLFFLFLRHIYLVSHRHQCFWLHPGLAPLYNIHGHTPVVRVFPISSFYLHNKSLLFLTPPYTTQWISTHFKTYTDNILLGSSTNSNASLILYNRQRNSENILTLFSQSLKNVRLYNLIGLFILLNLTQE